MSQAAVSVILPSLPPESAIKVPESMNETDRAFLIRELGKVSTDYAKLNARDEEHRKALDARFKRLEARICGLEGKADASAGHSMALIERELELRNQRDAMRRDRIVSIGITFFVTAVLALVGFWLKSLMGG